MEKDNVTDVSTTHLFKDELNAEDIAAGLKASQRRRKISLIVAGFGLFLIIAGCIVGIVVLAVGGGENEAPIEETYFPSPRISYPKRLVFNKANFNSRSVGSAPDVGKDFGAIQAGCSGVMRGGQVCGWKQGKKNMAFVAKNPSGSDNVFQITYSQNQYGTDSGAQFYQRLKNLDNGAMLEYEVYFPKNFDFVKGGKLPGFHGGNLQCSGFSTKPNGNNCFTTRLMWREGGKAEAYMYVPLSDQNDDFCRQCTFPVGKTCQAFRNVKNCSWNRGNFRFPKARWTRVAQYVKMNTPGERNGVFEVYLNGAKKMSYTKLMFRKSSSLRLEGLYFSTFMGGASRAYAPSSTQTSYFRSFKIYAN